MRRDQETQFENPLGPQLGNRGRNRLSDHSRLATPIGSWLLFKTFSMLSWPQENHKYHSTPPKRLDAFLEWYSWTVGIHIPAQRKEQASDPHGCQKCESAQEGRTGYLGNASYFGRLEPECKPRAGSPVPGGSIVILQSLRNQPGPA